MGAVVDFAAARQERTPHISGNAKCLSCAHEWHGVAPVGTDVLDCPACSLPKGKFVNEVMRGTQVWVCNCGNDLFRIAPKTGVYCANCAAPQEGWFDA